MEKVMCFLDYANINRSANDKNISLDYGHLLNYLGEHRFMVDAFAYFPIDPRNEHGYDHDKENLWHNGYLVTAKVGSIAGNGFKCNMDIEMTMDILRAAYQAKPDTIILASGDSDFVPLVLELRKLGIRVEVAAFTENVSRDLITKSSGFIDLGLYYEDCFCEPEPELEETIADESAPITENQQDIFEQSETEQACSNSSTVVEDPENN